MISSMAQQYGKESNNNNSNIINMVSGWRRRYGILWVYYRVRVYFVVCATIKYHI